LSALEKMIRYFDENGYGMFAIIERKEKRLIGQCGLVLDQNSGLIELTFTLLPDAWGKGYATEACMEVLRFAFIELGIEKIISTLREENRASIRVLEKIGMAYSSRYKLSDQTVLLYKIERPLKAAGSLFQNTYSQRSKLSMPAL
ncbi:MAG: GNAT family N-acetyltransferase, partial [Candidatus Kapaibacterium sp.]